MAMNVTNNLNSAMTSGLQGLQKASEGISRNSADIASQQVDDRPAEATLSASRPDLTDSLVGLNTNLTYARASAEVVETTDAMIGRLIDEKA